MKRYQIIKIAEELAEPIHGFVSTYYLVLIRINEYWYSLCTCPNPESRTRQMRDPFLVDFMVWCLIDEIKMGKCKPWTKPLYSMDIEFIDVQENL